MLNYNYLLFIYCISISLPGTLHYSTPGPGTVYTVATVGSPSLPSRERWYRWVGSHRGPGARAGTVPGTVPGTGSPPGPERSVAFMENAANISLVSESKFSTKTVPVAVV